MKKELKKLEKVLPLIFDNSSVTATFRVKGKKAKLISLEVEDDFEEDDEPVIIEKKEKPKIGYIC